MRTKKQGSSFHSSSHLLAKTTLLNSFSENKAACTSSVLRLELTAKRGKASITKISRMYVWWHIHVQVFGQISILLELRSSCWSHFLGVCIMFNLNPLVSLHSSLYISKPAQSMKWNHWTLRGSLGGWPCNRIAEKKNVLCISHKTTDHREAITLTKSRWLPDSQGRNSSIGEWGWITQHGQVKWQHSLLISILTKLSCQATQKNCVPRTVRMCTNYWFTTWNHEENLLIEGCTEEGGWSKPRSRSAESFCIGKWSFQAVTGAIGAYR